MFSSDDYQLIDFGSGQKLERFGGELVCRPSPVAHGPKVSEASWKSPAVFRFELNESLKNSAGKGRWLDEPERDWDLAFGENVFTLRPTPFGHLGVFPEQADNWRWIMSHGSKLDGLKALNLFAYTGGTTLALARAGCQVTHVDAAVNVVKWARENARRSGLEAAPVRWIAEDTMRFVQREIKRGKHYDIVVADPPSFGRGPKNEVWKIQRDFQPLLSALSQLVQDQASLCIMSGHTPEFDHHQLKRLTREHLLGRTLERQRMDWPQRGGAAFPMSLATDDGRELPAGFCYRWSRWHQTLGDSC